MTSVDAGNESDASLQDEDTLKDKYLTFHVGDEDYGIGIEFVTEIIGIQKITEVPETPSYLKGVINLRGKVIPVMDIRVRFMMEEMEYTERTCVIVVNYQEVQVGLVVDAVSDVTLIPEASIEASPNLGSNSDHYVMGMGKVGDSIKMLLDVNKLLYDDENLVTINNQS